MSPCPGSIPPAWQREVYFNLSLHFSMSCDSIVVGMKPTSDWLKKDGIYWLPWLTLWEYIGFRCCLIQHCNNPVSGYFLALFCEVLASWATPGTCHFPYRNASRKSAFSPAAPMEVFLYLTGSCWVTDLILNQPLGQKELAALMTQQTCILRLHLEQEAESSG